MAEIKTVSIKHMEIMDFLMANPTMALGQVAAHFGITQPWLSQVIHSDAFQAVLRTKQDVAFHHTVLSVREKVEHVAHMALDRLATVLPLETDTAVIGKVADSVLSRLGYGTQPVAGGTVNNTYNTQVNVLRNELDEARQLLGKAERPQIGVTIDESGKLPSLPIPDAQFTALGASDLGETATVYPASGNLGSTEKGLTS